jgi:hypothetical protein
MANEQRLIDANDAEQFAREHILDAKERYTVLDFLRECSTVDAVEVVHGRWLYDSGSGKYVCSACDEYALSFKKDTLYGSDLYEVCLTDYCPNCGAKMDGGNEDG